MTEERDVPQPEPADEQHDGEGETQEAQEAHGGSMAPEWVDPTGHPTGDAPA